MLLIDSCYRNRDKLGPDELATWLVCRLHLLKQIKSYKLCDSLLFRKLTQFKAGTVYLVWSHPCTVNVSLENFLQNSGRLRFDF